MADSDNIEIYTDGACSPNHGPGGYGVIIMRGGARTEQAGGFRNTTNNRMEIMAALEGLRAIKENGGAPVTVYSDSRYLVDMFNGGHAAKWRANGWRLASRKPALNVDLWECLLELAGEHVSFEWVKGHNEHPENERCDEMAVEARLREGLPPDTAYEAIKAMPEPEQLSLF